MILFIINNNKNLGIGNLKRCQLLKNKLKNEYKCFFYNEKKINLIKLKQIILKKNIKFVFIDNYEVKSNHRIFFKKLKCKIIQLNYFVDNDNHIDFFLNYLKKKKNDKIKIINDLESIILAPYKKFKNVKKNLILFYFSVLDPNILIKLLSFLKNRTNYKLIIISAFDIPIQLKKKFSKNIIIKNNIKHINYYLSKSKILISGGGLMALEATRYNVKNIVIYNNKFQKLNSLFLIKKKLIAFRHSSKNLNYKDIARNIEFLTKSKKRFNFIPRYSLNNAVREIIKFIKKNI